MGMDRDELYKMREEISRLKSKLIATQAHCYELLAKDQPPVPENDLKAQNYYLTQELKKVIEQRDRYKKIKEGLVGLKVDLSDQK